MQFELKVTGIQEALDFLARWSLEKFISQVVDPWGQQLQGSLTQQLYAYVNQRTGATGDSFSYRLDGDHLLWTGDLVSYFLAVGTRAHPISGNPFLAFPDGGVRQGTVQHPGTKPYAYRQAAVAASISNMAKVGKERALAILMGG